MEGRLAFNTYQKDKYTRYGIKFYILANEKASNVGTSIFITVFLKI